MDSTVTTSESATSRGPARLWLTWCALSCVYLAWGGTFPAYRVMLRSLPPVLAMGVRCLLCGVVLCGWLWLRRGRRSLRVGPGQLLGSGVIGGLVLGAITVTAVLERRVPAGTAALIIGSVPLWVTFLRLANRERVPVVVGLAIVAGFAGTALVILHRTEGTPLPWVLGMVVAAIMEAAGTYYAARVPRPADGLLNTAIQLIIVGVLCVALSAVTGEAGQLRLDTLSADSLWAFGYLTVVATLVAYTAFAWLAANHPPSLVATYAYVNPVIAVIVSWLLLGETLGPGALAGAALTIVSVALVIYLESRAERR